MSVSGRRRWSDGWSSTDRAIAEQVEDGELRGLSAAAQVVVARSRVQRDREGEARALLVAAFLDVAMGSFATAVQMLDIADDVVDELDHGRDAMRSVAAACRAVVASTRGQPATADRLFAAAVDLVRNAGAREVEALVLALRSESTATADPRRAIADARRVRDLCPVASVPFWSTAERGQAMATAALGQRGAAEANLAHLLEHPLPRLQRGRTLLCLAEVRAHHGDREGAAAAFDDASELFAAVGARHLLFRALHGHASVAPRRRARLLTRAAPLFAADPAYELVRGRLNLVVRTFGAGSLEVGGAAITFSSSKTLLLVCALATSSGALHWETLADRLWPDVEADRARASLRTALWDARRALGPEAWRLHRRGDLVLFELDGVTVDLVAARVEALVALGADGVDGPRLRELAATLEQPVLSMAPYHEWVVVLDDERRELLARVHARLGILP